MKFFFVVKRGKNKLDHENKREIFNVFIFFVWILDKWKLSIENIKLDKKAFPVCIHFEFHNLQRYDTHAFKQKIVVKISYSFEKMVFISALQTGYNQHGFSPLK